MKGRTLIQCIFVFIYVFVQLCGGVRGATGKPNIEKTPQSSADVIMREDAEEMFYNVDLEKYDELGIKCPELEPPRNGAIVGEGVKVGSVVYVQCNQGYRLEGPTVMACVPAKGGAQWDPVVKRVCVAGNTQFQESSVETKTDYETPEHEMAPKEPRHDEYTENKIKKPSFLNPKVQRSWMKRQKLGRVERTDEEVQASPNQEQLDRAPPACHERLQRGPCRALFRRFYFDKTTMECHPFEFGGCHGNKNNFESIEECNLTCLGHE